jgi:hypothetical protein
MAIDARLQSLFYLSSRVPNKGALPPGYLHRILIERNAAPLVTCNVLVDVIADTK